MAGLVDAMVRARPLVLLLALALAAPAGEAAAQFGRRKKPKEPEPQVLIPVTPARPPEAPKPTLARLMSADEAQVRAELGLPDIARDEGAAALWTYRWDDCALLVFFRRADGKTLRVSGAESNPRRRNQRQLTVDACLAHAREKPRESMMDTGAIDALLEPPR